MDRQPAAVYVVGLFAQQVEHLRIAHGDQEIEGAVGIGHDDIQHRFAVAQGIQFQFIIGGQLPQLLNIEAGKPRADADKYTFRRLA